MMFFSSKREPGTVGYSAMASVVDLIETVLSGGNDLEWLLEAGAG
jgi:hypothetical protein